jgi:predicted kinase
LTIIESTQHSRHSLYIDPGFDSTVSWKSLDLKMMNNYPFPIKISTETYRDKKKGHLIIKILGEKQIFQTKIIVDISKKEKYKTKKIFRRDLPKGYRKLVEPGTYKIRMVRTRQIYRLETNNLILEEILKLRKKFFMNKKLVVIPRAPSGSGKSTYLKNNYPDAFVCSADHALYENGKYVWAAEKLGKAHFYCMNAFKAALINNLPLIAVDNTNIYARDMKPYVELAKEYGYEVKIVRIVAPVAVAAKRNTHNVPEEIVNMQNTKMSDIPEIWGIKEEIFNNE